MKAVVKVTLTKYFNIEIECADLDQLINDVKHNSSVTEQLDVAVGNRYLDPDRETMEYKVLGQSTDEA
jgi:hypothetical protein